MASSSTMTAVVSSEINDGENKSVVNTTSTGGSESLFTDVVGAKFKPTDEILAGHYLARKVYDRTDGQNFEFIKSVDVYRREPWQLPSAAHDFGDGIMYLFSPVKMKYDKGTNVDRSAGNGFWKITGNSSDIKAEDGTTIATKTPLAYYKNGQKSDELPMKTQWLMKEFLLKKQSDEKSNKQLALCVVYLHDRKRKKCESNQNVSCDDVAVEGSSESYAENLAMLSEPDQDPDFSWKRHRSSCGIGEMFSVINPTSFNDLNQGKASCSNAQCDTSTEPSVTLESLPEDMIRVAADSNVHNIPNYVQSLTDFVNYLPNSDYPQDKLWNELLADPISSCDQSLTDFGNYLPNSDCPQDKLWNELLADPIPSYLLEDAIPNCDRSPFSDFGNWPPNSNSDDRVEKFMNYLLEDPIPNCDRSPLSDFGNLFPNSDDSPDPIMNDLPAEQQPRPYPHEDPNSAVGYNDLFFCSDLLVNPSELLYYPALNEDLF